MGSTEFGERMLSPAQPPKCVMNFSKTRTPRCKIAGCLLSPLASVTRNEPLADLISSNKSFDILSYEGWAYCARTPDKNIFLAFLEKGSPASEIRGAKLNSVYSAQWFNPATGTWSDVGSGTLIASKIGVVKLPKVPDGGKDWGLKLEYKGPAEKKTVDRE